MSLNKRIFFGAMAHSASRAVTILLGMLLIPVLFRNLPKDELGIWLLLGQSWAVLGILDLGFGVTLGRRIAFVKGLYGSADSLELTDQAAAEIAAITATGRVIYKVLAVLAFIVSFGLGLWYLQTITLVSVTLSTVLLAWGVMCLSQALNVLATPWTCLLQGVGYVGWDALLTSCVASLICISQIVAALLGGGLVSMAVIAAVGSLVQRALFLFAAKKKCPALFQFQGQPDKRIFWEMLPLAWRAWLTAIGGVIISSTDQFFIASQDGISELPAYRAAFILLINLHLVAGVFTSVSQIFVSQLWARQDLENIRTLIRRNTLIGILTLGCCGATIVGLQSSLFDLWLGPGNYIGLPIFGLFLAAFILEHHSNIFSTIGRATNDEAFAWTSLIAAGLKVIFAVIGMRMYGLLGLAASTLLAQALTSSWFPVYRTSKRLKLHLGEHFLYTLLPCVLFSVLSLACSSFVLHVLDGRAAWIKVVTATICSGGLLVVALWIFVLTRSQRERVCSWLRVA